MTPVIVTVEGQRASDVVQTHLANSTEAVGRWVALRLSDGGSDGVLYDSRPDAVRHQQSPEQRAYVQIPPTGMPPADASRLLVAWRAFYDGGFRLTDPDDRRDPVMPWTEEDLRELVRGITPGGRR